jgi:F-type H+-transporting ATPase subunit epsilon
MALTVHVDILGPEEQLFSGIAEMVIAPAHDGEIGILPRHTPLLARLNPGIVRVKKPFGEEEIFYVSGGYLDVHPDRVTILADTIVRGADLDEARALEAKRKAEEALRDRQGDINYAKVEAELANAMAQLRALEKIRKRKAAK